MGLTFHYSAQFRNTEKITEMITEVKDICISLNWEYQVWPECIAGMDIPEFQIENYRMNNLQGISLTPEKCETLLLTFLPGGKLVSPTDFILGADIGPFAKNRMIHTKTQFAGIHVHLALMKLLIYLNEKYFEKLHVEDEGNYWETRNEEILKKQFNEYEHLFDVVAGALSSIEKIPGESAKSVADRIEIILNEKFKNKNP